MALDLKSVLVVGGRGFLGRRLVDTLLLLKPIPNISVFDLPLRVPIEPEAQSSVAFYDGDITKKEDVMSTLEKARPNVIFHTASPDATSQVYDLFFKVNVEGTKILLECAKATGVKAFVYTSSASVIHDGQSGLLWGDDTYPLVFQPRQKDVYSHTKALADQIVLEANMQNGVMMTVSLRPSGIFGEGVATVKALVEAAAAGRYRFQMGDGKNLFDWTYIGNVVDAHLLAAEALLQESCTTNIIPDEKRVNGEGFVITNDEPMPFWDYLRGLGAAAGYPTDPSSVRKIPRSFGFIIGAIAEWVVWAMSLGRKKSTISRMTIRYSTMTRTYRIDKIKRRLGYKPRVGMKEAINRAGGSFLGKIGGKRKEM